MTNEDIFVIGICGFAGSGKNTFSNFLVENYGFKEFSFAEALKDVLSCVFGWERSLLEGDTKESREWREMPDKLWGENLGIENFTPRKAMQMIGTSLFRNFFHKDIWAIALKNKIINSKCKKVVITDCRFLNEFEILKSSFKNFYVFGIVRWVPCQEEWYKEITLKIDSDEKYNAFKVKMANNSNISYHESDYEWMWALNKFKDIKYFKIYNLDETVEYAKINFRIKIEEIVENFRFSCGDLHPLVVAFSP